MGKPNLVKRGLARKSLLSGKLVKRRPKRQRPLSFKELRAQTERELAAADALLTHSKRARTLREKNAALVQAKQRLKQEKAGLAKAVAELKALVKQKPKTADEASLLSAKLSRLRKGLAKRRTRAKSLSRQEQALIQELRQGSAKNKALKEEHKF
jgi:hypothetical protein